MISVNQQTIKNLYWEKGYTVPDIAKRINISSWALYNFMDRHKIGRRDRSQTSFLLSRNKPRFIINNTLTASQEKLKIAGVMLYWAEGTLLHNTVDFTNSNSNMVRLFLKFLREICGISEKRLRVYLYCYSYQKVEDLLNYWHKVTGIPLSQFTKPYIREGNINSSLRKLPYGLIHVRYNDKQLLEIIKQWIDEYIVWTGTQVAKGGRLCKRSVLPKGRMEK
ncbi:MAG: hypothetical protein NTU54_06005 [Candidatus Omnitrophica bacterium]|nr:hypothetical protein [Candidatus Omnitrophota bacterium]